MNRKIIVCLLAGCLMCIALFAEAQQPKKVARICHLGNTVSGREGGLPPFRQRLRELGYIDGQNITIEAKYWEGKVERLPELANELIRLNCALSSPLGLKRRGLLKMGPKGFPLS